MLSRSVPARLTCSAAAYRTGTFLWSHSRSPGPNGGQMLRVMRRECRTSLSANCGCWPAPADERIRHAHPGAGMLTVAAPSGSGGAPAAVTDGGGRADMRRASTRLIEASLARDQGLSAVPAEMMTAEYLTLFRRGITVGLSQVRRVPGARASSHPPGSCWSACGTARRTCCGSCPTPPSPTSNQAERDLRPSKTQQKISGRLRSEKTTRDRYGIRGYASTAAKHRIAVFTAIRDTPETPGYHPSRQPPELRPKPITQRSSPVIQAKT